MARPARDDERVPVAEAGLRARESRSPRRAAAPPRAGSASCCRRTPAAPRSRGLAALRAHRRARAPRASGRSRRTCRCGRGSPPRTVSRSPSEISSKSSPPVDVDQAHAAADEQERAWVRVAAGVRRRHVDDDADAGLDELLGRDAVEIGVVDDRDVVGFSRRTSSFVRLPSRAVPVCSTKAHQCSSQRGDELLAAEHPLELVAALRVVEQLDPRVRRVAGNLLDPEVPRRRRSRSAAGA